MNKWNDWELPTNVIMNGIEFKIRSDYRIILEIFQVFNDIELIDNEKIYIALQYFYEDFDSIKYFEQAMKIMYKFINGNKEEESNGEEKPLVDWTNDISIIIPPVNKVLGLEVRSQDYMHWWTFLGAFMEIGECTFSTYVSIRNKKNKNKKLEKHEQEIYRENKSKIDIKTCEQIKIDKEIEEQFQAMLRGDI